MSLIESVHHLIASKRLLDHPFYTAWTRGTLTRAALETYAAQYYHWVDAFPTWLSAAHANAPNRAMRQEILENLIDEERGPENHPELWLRFCDALGLDREAVTGGPLQPETQTAIEMMRGVCREEPAVAGIAALYAYESQQPEVMTSKRHGLTTHYGLTTGLQYFDVHAALDVEHSAGERALVERFGSGCEAAVLAGTGTALDATYRLLDGMPRS